MARKALIEKANRKPKYSTRALTDASVVEGLEHIFVNLPCVEFVSVNWLTRAKYLVLRKPVGKMEGGWKSECN